MHIERLMVEHWRGLTWALDELSPGLNLICGPNEAGKSRLVEALRFALFESSRGQSRHKRALKSWGDEGAPRVEVSFVLEGTRWSLEKRFLGTGCNTRLRSAGEHLEGEEAEARLAQLMGVAPAGSAERKAEDRGIWSLLWVDQGQSWKAPSHNPDSQARLQDQLAAEVGEVAAGALGQRMLEQARALNDTFYTTRDAERGALRAAREQVERLEAAWQEALQQHQAVMDDARALEDLRRRSGTLDGRLLEAESRHSQIDARHRQARQAERALNDREHEAELARLAQTRCEEAWGDFIQTSAQVARLDQELETLNRHHAEALAARARATAAHDEAVAAVEHGDAALAELARELDHRRAERRAGELRDTEARLRERLQEADGIIQRLDEARRRRSALAAIEPDDVERLREAHQTAEQARARLEGASATLQLTARRDLQIDGERLAAGESRTLLIQEERHFEIDGVLALLVRPGGGELARLRDTANDAAEALRELLTRLGVDDVTSAEQTAQARRDLEVAIRHHRETLARLLPEGRDEVATTLRAVTEQLANLGDAARSEFDAAALERAEARHREITEERERCRARRDAAATALADARERAHVLETQRDGKRQQRDQLAERLAALPDEADLKERLEAARRHYGERVAARDAARAEFEALGGEALELDLQQAEQALAQVRAEREDVQRQCLQIEARLEAVGDEGRYEHVQEREAELNEARAALARVEREARAARRLYRVLSDEYQSARQRLAQPVIERIRPYLVELFPGSEAWLDDEMNLLGLRGARFDEDFDALSGGAREQLSLLVRIGLAEVIGAEEPWPLILDDVLVNTDAERIRRMQGLLFRAARRMQILLFTCHGPLFDLLGPDRRIELAAAAVSPPGRARGSGRSPSPRAP